MADARSIGFSVPSRLDKEVRRVQEDQLMVQKVILSTVCSFFLNYMTKGANEAKIEV